MKKNDKKSKPKAKRSPKEAKLRKEIEKDLRDQLERNGTIGKFYFDLVTDYLSFWDSKTLLFADVKLRGVSVEYNNGGGQSGFKKNDSVDQLIKINAQMLKILTELGVRPAQCAGGAGGDEDDEDDEYNKL